MREKELLRCVLAFLLLVMLPFSIVGCGGSGREEPCHTAQCGQPSPPLDAKDSSSDTSGPDLLLGDLGGPSPDVSLVAELDSKAPLADDTVAPPDAVPCDASACVGQQQCTSSGVCACSGAVSFADAALEKRIRTLLNLPAGSIDASTLAGVESLALSGVSPTSLSGIECFVDLRAFSLADATQLAEIDALSGLGQLETLAHPRHVPTPRAQHVPQ